MLNAPEFSELVGFGLRELQEDGSGGIREAFTHPLIAITAEANGLAPPLVRNFVRSDHLPVHVFRMHAQRKLLRGIEKAADGQIDVLVYKLYELTEEEIEIVEGSTNAK